MIVWTYGGGFTGGAGSLAMYDGEALAKKGAVVVTYNYRLGVFGFLAHPELTKESGHNASGNYGDDGHGGGAASGCRRTSRISAAIRKRVTIDGESAGAMLVSAMVGSPEGKGLFAARHRAKRRVDGHQHRSHDHARRRLRRRDRSWRKDWARRRSPICAPSQPTNF